MIRENLKRLGYDCNTIGNTQFGKTTAALQPEQNIVVIKGIPAQVYEDCGKYYLDDTVARCGGNHPLCRLTTTS